MSRCRLGLAQRSGGDTTWRASSGSCRPTNHSAGIQHSRIGAFALVANTNPWTTTPDTPPHPRTTPLYNTLQQSQALRLAPSRCWPGQVCALRAPSAPQGPKQPRTLRCVKYTHPSARARQTPETIGNAASGDGGSSMVHMGADGRWITAQCLHPERGRRLLLEERRNPLRLDRARRWNLRLLLLPVCPPGARHDSRRGGVSHLNTPMRALGGLQWATEKDGTSTNASPAVFTLPPTRGSTRSTSRPSTTPLSAVVSRSTVRSAPPATLSPVSHGAHLSAP